MHLLKNKYYLRNLIDLDFQKLIFLRPSLRWVFLIIFLRTFNDIDYYKYIFQEYTSIFKSLHYHQFFFKHSSNFFFFKNTFFKDLCQLLSKKNIFKDLQWYRFFLIFFLKSFINIDFLKIYIFLNFLINVHFWKIVFQGLLGKWIFTKKLFNKIHKRRFFELFLQDLRCFEDNKSLY